MCNFRQLKIICLRFFSFLIVGIGISVGVICYFIYHGPARKVEKSYQVSLNETRSINYSSVWCSHVSVESKPYVDTTLYLLKEPPEVTDHDFLKISQFKPFYNRVQYFAFHLYPGSYFHMDVCFVSPASMGLTLLFVMEDTNFIKWQHSDYTDSSCINSSFPIENCDTSPHHFFSKVDKEETYYIVFLNKTGSLDVMVNLSIQLYRSKLAITSSNTLDHCKTARDYETCYLDTVYRQEYPLALAVSPPKSANNDGGEVWLKIYTVTLQCRDRYVFYIVMGVGFALVSVLIAAVAGVGCRASLCARCFNKRGDLELNTQAPLLSSYGTLSNNIEPSKS